MNLEVNAWLLTGFEEEDEYLPPHRVTAPQLLADAGAKIDLQRLAWKSGRAHPAIRL